MHFRLQIFTADAFAPVGSAVMLYVLEDMFVAIRRTQHKGAMNTYDIFPFFRVTIGSVLNVRCGIMAILAFTMMAGFVCCICIVMFDFSRTDICTYVACLVAVSRINMRNRICAQTTLYAHAPVIAGVVLIVSIETMTIFLRVTTGVTGEETSSGEAMFSMCQTTAAISAAGPMI